MRIPLVIAVPVVTIAFAAAGAYYLGQGNAAQKQPLARQQGKSTAINQAERLGTQEPPAFNKQSLPLDKATSLWLIVNKRRPLQPEIYVPQPLVIPHVALRSNISGDEQQLRQEASDALTRMFTAASADGVTLNLQSGYRSHSFQQALYRRYVRLQGQAVADTESARPGHSEHQTGLAADVGGITEPGCNIEACFADTAEGKWVAAQAHKHGFIVRYPPEKTPVTGYVYEPWHLRYVGPELATEMHRQKAETLEEFFGLPAAPDYN